MANITSIVENFIAELSALPLEGGHETVANILEPSIQAEQELRTLYAQQPPLPYLDAPYLGLINVPLDGLEIGYQFQQGWSCPFPQHYLLPLHPFLRRAHGSPALVESLEDFRANWEIFTHNALSQISDWSNIVVAGGSILACLLPLLPQTSNIEMNNFFQSNAYSDSDIDIFLWGLSPEQAKAKMEDLFRMIKQALPWRVTCVRKLNTISIHTNYPIRPIQIILCLYRSPAEILAGFDVDSACCLYNGTNVYITARALTACIRQANLIDITRRSPSYEVRLAKYADRGFEVYLPSLDRTRLDYEKLYSNNLTAFPKGLGRLVVLEFMRESPYHYPSLYPPGTGASKVPPATADPSYQPMDFKPVEKTLLKNNYDGIWVRIPYKSGWDAERVARLVQSIDSKLNSEYILSLESRRLHRHAAFCGTMTECLGDFCATCPVPINDEEREMARRDASKFFRGPVQFIKLNAGRQIISGSFSPLGEENWAQDAYTDDICDRLVYITGDPDQTPSHMAPNPGLGFPDANNSDPTDIVPAEGEVSSELAISFEDLDLAGIVEESEGSSYYSDAFGSELSDLELD